MESVWFPSRRGFSVRSILIFVMTAVITVFLTSSLVTPSAQAQAPEVTWANENTILYNSNSYNRVENFNDPTNTVPSGASVYQTSPQTVANSRDQKVFVLYFTSGVDPPTATSAQYVEFNFNNDTLSNPANSASVTATPRGQESSNQSSCSVSGIGWIICPVSVFLAEAMDNIFNILSEMIAVQPAVLGDTNNSMYVAWNVMRSIANIAFVIAFIIIIYAQLTSIAVSNYGIKKLLPRLVIAAVLVNLSFYVAALAIDISNILGYSIQDVFNVIREQLFFMTNDTTTGVLSDPDWAVVTSIILGGGGTIGAIYYVSTGGLYLLIPILIGLFLTVLFVVIVLAARQAIILILVIIAPLAFVANLLPNTEKWFEKWRDLFMTMLIFFPAFSLVFGGSQLAGQLIIQSAGDNIISLLFGMAVQIAPLVITPLLLKFSGSLLGRIAQIANDPRKGVLDRSKNWAGERAELHKQRNLQRNTGKNPLTWGAGMVQSVENGRRKRRGMTDMYKQRADNMWHKSAEYSDLHEKVHEAETDKKIIDSNLEIHTAKAVRADNVKLEKELTARVRADQAADFKGRLDSSYEDLKSGKADFASRGRGFGELETEAAETTRAIALNAMRQQSAQRAQKEDIYKALKDNSATLEGVQLRDYAGGVQGHIGAQRALAQSISERLKAHSEVISNANAILDDYNLNAESNLSIAKNIPIKGVGIEITPDIQEAAIKRVASNGVIPHINDLLTSIDLTPTGNEDYRTALVEALRSNGNRPKYIGQGLMDKLTQGIPGGVTDNTINDWIESMLLDGKLSAKEMSSQDKDTLERIMQAMPRLATRQRSGEKQTAFDKALVNLQNEIVSVRADDMLWNTAAERKPIIERLDGFLTGYTGTVGAPPSLRDDEMTERNPNIGPGSPDS